MANAIAHKKNLLKIRKPIDLDLVKSVLSTISKQKRTKALINSILFDIEAITDYIQGRDISAPSPTLGDRGRVGRRCKGGVTSHA
jgi:hypothetical protein